MAISQQDYHQMQQRLGKAKAAPKPAPAPLPPPEMADLIMVNPAGYWMKEFTYLGKPIGKPRMTRLDRFVKRPKAVKYWAFKDAIKAAAGPLAPNPDIVIVTAWCPMPKSWANKKRAEHNGRPCRAIPDWDNIGKAVCDSLFDEDKCLWGGAVFKYWCPLGQEKLNVKILYAKHQNSQ